MRPLLFALVLASCTGPRSDHETDIDDCATGPCFNGGTCTDGENAFTCACAAGFTGRQCETNVDDCAQAPCMNGGECVDRVAGYACICPLGFTGASCETNIDDCPRDVCMHDGVCVDGLRSFSCMCPSGTWGVLCEAAIPQLALSSTVLPNAVSGATYSAQLVRSGGASSAAWSMETDAPWLTIGPTNGWLSGQAAGSGVFSVAVRVEDSRYPANFAAHTFTFTTFGALDPTYATGFESACPDGWTLTGDWQCGTPSNAGPPAAFGGTNCIGTQLGSNYSALQTYTTATATSPDIALRGDMPQVLRFKAWVDTEAPYDGFLLQISDDGGATYPDLVTVSPEYNLTVAGHHAWGGQQSALAWQSFSADLSAFEGQTISLRFAFQSDASTSFAGVYIDDIAISYR